jgi:WD40 repeat protein
MTIGTLTHFHHTEEHMNTFDWIKTAFIGSIAAISLALAQTNSFDPKKASEILEMTGIDSETMDMEFSPDGKFLAVASKDNGIARLWDVEQGRIATQLEGHQDGISGLNFSSDGKSLVTLGNDDLLKTWNVSSGKESASFNLKCNGRINGDVVLLKDNRAVVVCDGLKMVDLKNGKVVGTFKGGSLAKKLSLSTDQRTILGSLGESEFQLWDIKSLELFRTLKGHVNQGYAVSYSSNGKLLATGAFDSTVRIWNATNGKELFVLKGHESSINDVAFSPDSKILASASTDNTVKLWDTLSGEEIETLEGHQRDVVQLAWSKDGKILASGDSGGKIKLWGNP